MLHGCIVSEFSRKKLREAAADVDTADAVGQRIIDERAERNNLSAPSLQKVQRVLIVEVKRLVLRHRNTRPAWLRFSRESGRYNAWSIRTPRDFKQAVEVYRLLHLFGELVEPLFDHHALDGRDKPKMALRHAQIVASRHVSQHRQSCRVLDGRLAEFQMSRATHAVEDDASDVHRRIELLEAQHLGGDAARHSCRACNQHHRRAQQLGDLSG